MAYHYIINGKWILCNQEDNELLVHLETFLSPFRGARYPDGTMLSLKESMTVRDIAIMRWCERRHINLSWLARPNEIAGPSVFDSLGRTGDKYLLVFEAPQDAMLFKLHFNNDSRVDS